MPYPHPMDDKTGFEATDEEMGLPHQDEVAWLIEFSGQATPTYYGKTEEGLGMTRDHNAAVRFSRREDAQAVIDDIGWTPGEVRPVEHMWCAPRSVSSERTS